jgi:hypothetical protein
MAGAHGGGVTRDVEPEALRDLLAHPPRATVAFVHDGTPDALPALLRVDGTTHWFAVADGGAPDLDGREVVVVVDDGPYWFQLRGVSIRGTARRAAAPDEPVPAGLVWYAVATRRTLAWDYATLRMA